MNEMKIKLIMNAEKDIVITNEGTNASLTITSKEKNITAPSIYDLLSYQPLSTYKIENNLEEITDENDKRYFTEVISLFNSIISDVNDITKSTNQDNSGEDSQASE